MHEASRGRGLPMIGPTACLLLGAVVLANGLAARSSNAAERYIQRGVFVYWGNVIEAPFWIAYTDSDFVVKGLRVPRPMPPRPVTLDPDREQVFRLGRRVFAEAERDRARGAPRDTIVARALRTLQASKLVRKAEILGPHDINVMWTAGEGEIMTFHPSASPRELEAGRLHHLDHLAEMLQEYVIVESGGYTIYVSLPAGSDVTRLLARFRAGERNAFSGHHKAIEQSLLHPHQLERATK